MCKPEEIYSNYLLTMSLKGFQSSFVSHKRLWRAVIYYSYVDLAAWIQHPGSVKKPSQKIVILSLKDKISGINLYTSTNRVYL